MKYERDTSIYSYIIHINVKINEETEMLLKVVRSNQQKSAYEDSRYWRNTIQRAVEKSSLKNAYVAAF